MDAVQPLLTAVRAPHLRAGAALRRDSKAFARLHVLRSLLESGLLDALRTPATRDELARSARVERVDLLDALLALAVEVGALAERDGRYSLRSQAARALASADADPLRAVLEETVEYHSAVFLDLPKRLHGSPDGDYLAQRADLVARSSRVVEPFLVPFVRRVAGPPRKRLLEIGCGSGIYVRHAAAANESLTGTAIDLEEEVAARARANLEAWGLGERFRVLAADVRDPPPELDGPFDVITLYNNVYYFEPSARPRLFADLRARLAEGGVLAIATLVREGGLAAAELDLVLRSTAGCSPLPTPDELEREARGSGFGRFDRNRLMPLEPLYGMVAG